ncbi:MAG: CMP/dCMP kinase [Chloroflexia bacterium]|jgi:cytidylate kinase|nr:CMP/dCMP kinase [Chloroflexia bacterium]
MVVKKGLVIAIDGPASSGKGTIGSLVASRLNYKFIDTGAMYRSVALLALDQGIDLQNSNAVGQLAEASEIKFVYESIRGVPGYRVLIDGMDVSIAIRSPTIDSAASQIAQYVAVRHALQAKQRVLAQNGSVVMEGRDITTVVFPNADLKLYITASIHQRARRRYEQNAKRNIHVSVKDIEEELAKRDRMDTQRHASPLQLARDAIVVDTTHMTVAEAVDKILSLIRERFPQYVDVS